MSKRLVLLALVLFSVGVLLGLSIMAHYLAQFEEKIVISSSETTSVSIRQYGSDGKLIGNWSGKYSVEIIDGVIVATDEDGRKMILTGNGIIEVTDDPVR